MAAEQDAKFGQEESRAYSRFPGSGNGHCGDQEKAVFAAEDVKPGRLGYQFLRGGCPCPQVIGVMQR